MKLNQMRFIDYWVGIPLSFFFSVCRFIQARFLRKGINSNRCKKVLFMEFSEMGSAILAYPAIKRIKDLTQDAKVYFWIFTRNRKSVDVLDIISEENVITIRDDTFFHLAIDTLRSLYKIRREKIDTVIDMELFSRFSSILTFLTGAREKVGFYRFSQEGLYRGNLHDIKVQYNPHLHISQNFMALVESIKDSSKDISLKKAITRSDIKLPVANSSKGRREGMFNRLKGIKDTLEKSKNLIILNPLISELLPLRSWSIENYLTLAQKFLEDPDNFIVMIGLESSSDERRMLSKIVGHERCIDLIGKTSFEDLKDLFSISRLLISHDSGPVHFASLTNINMVILFGPETPVCYAPLSSNSTIMYSNFACSPCVSAYNHRRSLCEDNKCLQAITVDDVFKAANKYLLGSAV